MSAGYLKKCSSGGKPKRRYETRAAAETQRSWLIAAGTWTRGGSNVYRCNVCGFYHAGKLGLLNRGTGKRVAKVKPTLATQ